MMQKRIYKVLIICSNYDFFLLEEDGRIDEQIYNEYVSLNLRYPPIFLQAQNGEQAFKMLQEDKIDLIISTMNIGAMDAFQFSKCLKVNYPNIPVVLLTHFSREVSLRLAHEDTSALDHVFCWLGKAEIILAIIKLIEDRMNLDDDLERNGVQAILLVEDSIRFYSSYLPNLYRIILNQSKEFMHEGLNEHQSMLRLRGRPKIILVNNYNDAVKYFEKYQNNLLGIISDVNYKKDGVSTKDAGILFAKRVKEEDQYFPFLLQSSQADVEIIAKEIKVGFINKNSKTLSQELREFVQRFFAFGDFEFQNPDTYEVIEKASDLKELQKMLRKIPDDCLLYHVNRNHISKWLRARALFKLADIFKPLTPEDFDNLEGIRRFMVEAISEFRLNKGRGVISAYDRNRYDEYLNFSRIGEGSLGGKARGLAFIDSLIKKHELFNKYENVIIKIPRTVVLATDVFDEYMETNNLYKIGISDLSDDEILNHFINSRLPFRIHKDLSTFISVTKNPIAIRSSSVLEDSHYQPFAGIYSTYMIPKNECNPALMMKMLTDAIKSVYASVYFKNSKTYMTATHNVIDEEKMAIVLQEVCGCRYGNVFYPTISGVARSINFYPIEPEKPSDGIANIAMGLGRIIVDGGKTLRLSPKYPHKVLQLSSPEMTLRDTQQYFYALDLDTDSFKPSTDDGVNILKLKIKDAEKDNSIKFVASTFDLQNNMIRDGANYQGKKIITFANILKNNTFPLTDILTTLLELGQKEMNNPIEIEFACNLDVPKGSPKVFSFLQIRPIVESNEVVNFNLEDVPEQQTIIYSKMALGNGSIKDIYDFVYVKPETFNAADSQQIALNVEKVNEQFLKERKNYILVGPGRWGSSDPWLGIPVSWSQISAARVIVEAGLPNFRIEPSQGTHFFQNLTSFKVGYFTINPFIHDGFYDVEYLSQFPAVYEDKYVRHVHFDTPLNIKINGATNRGVVYKVGEGEI